VIGSPSVTWLANAEERGVHLAGATAPDVLSEAPIGVDPDGRVVLPFLVTKDRIDHFRPFLQRHARLLSTLPAWTVRVAVPADLHWRSERYQEVFRQELAKPTPDLVSEIRSYFKRRQAVATDPIAIQDDERYFEAKFAFGTPRFQVLYQRWLREGEAAFDVVSSRAIADAIASGAGRLECHVLPFSYRHLSPLVGQPDRARKGDEDGEDARTRPRPPVGSANRLTDRPEVVPPAGASALEGAAL
jgi:hypothetical protein